MSEALLKKLSRQGIRLSVEQGYLCIAAPEQALDEDLKQLIAANKAELLEALEAHQHPAPCPYRVNLDGHPQVIWLRKGLSPAEVVEQARAQFGAERIADSSVPPAEGWPTLKSIPEIPAKGPEKPFKPCNCGNRRYWLDSAVWRCDACYPAPADFAGDTCTVPGAPSYPVTSVSREDLERIHPPIVEGLPLATILDQADIADYEDLADLSMLEAFARSLAATGTVTVPAPRDNPKPPAAADDLCGRVCCGDCQHFQPDTIGDGSGLGRCGAGRQTRYPEWPLYPRLPRFCSTFTHRYPWRDP